MYECGSCNKKFEELFLSRKEIEETVDCHFCDSPASKAGVQRFRHIGPVFEDLEHYTNNFYSAKQRADGKAVRSYKDIQKLEAENNFLDLIQSLLNIETMLSLLNKKCLKWAKHTTKEVTSDLLTISIKKKCKTQLVGLILSIRNGNLLLIQPKAQQDPVR